MKSRPIIFSAPMVLALLAGTKTQTRRAVKPQPRFEATKPLIGSNAGTWWLHISKAAGLNEVGFAGFDDRMPPEYADALRVRCPYGAPGDQLWVRESFIHEPADYVWEASVSIPCRPASTVYRADCKGDSRGAGWTSPMFMPRSLSRITLELTDVRVERLRDISETDCIAEGCAGGHGAIPGYPYHATPLAHYQDQWEQINDADSWYADPFVWALSFKRV